VSLLLDQYAQVLSNAERELTRVGPLVIPLPRSVRVRPEPLIRNYVPALPRPTWFTSFFIRAHVLRGLTALDRHLSLRYALDEVSGGEDVLRDRVKALRDAVRPVPRKTAIAFLVVTIVLLGRFAATEGKHIVAVLPTSNLISEAATFNEFNAGTGIVTRPHRKAVDPFAGVHSLLGNLADRLKLEPSEAGGVLDTLGKARPADLALLLASLGIVAYVILRPVVPAFRLSRMLLNLGPEYDAWRPTTTARWHVARSTGVYSHERSAFSHFQATPPKEPPFDLFVAALALCFPVALAAQLLSASTHYDDLPTVLSFAAATVWLLSAVALRLWWLVRTWLRRQAPAGVWAPVDVRRGEGRIKLRDPLVAFAWSWFVPYYLWLWWWLTHSDVAEAVPTVPGEGDASLHGFALSPPLRPFAAPALASAWQLWRVLRPGGVVLRLWKLGVYVGAALAFAILAYLNPLNFANAVAVRLPVLISVAVVPVLIIGMVARDMRRGRRRTSRRRNAAIWTLALTLAVVNFFLSVYGSDTYLSPLGLLVSVVVFALMIHGWGDDSTRGQSKARSAGVWTLDFVIAFIATAAGTVISFSGNGFVMNVIFAPVAVYVLQKRAIDVVTLRDYEPEGPT
jgi:hypothetical protein